MASNLTSGNNQRYETPGLDILQGLKPDIAAMQEFNVTNQFGINTTAAIGNMVAATFGTNFSYFRQLDHQRHCNLTHLIILLHQFDQQRFTEILPRCLFFAVTASDYFSALLKTSPLFKRVLNRRPALTFAASRSTLPLTASIVIE